VKQCCLVIAFCSRSCRLSLYATFHLFISSVGVIVGVTHDISDYALWMYCCNVWCLIWVSVTFVVFLCFTIYTKMHIFSKFSYLVSLYVKNDKSYVCMCLCRCNLKYKLLCRTCHHPPCRCRFWFCFNGMSCNGVKVLLPFCKPSYLIIIFRYHL
jgi:hypothetical protein